MKMTLNKLTACRPCCNTVAARARLSAAFLLCCNMVVALFFASCADYGDATKEISVQVQIAMPDGLSMPDDSQWVTENVSVTLTRGTQQVTSLVGRNHTAAFSGIVPDVYDISFSKELSADEYERWAGHPLDGGTSCTLTATQNACVLKEDGQVVQLNATLGINQDIVIGKLYYAGSTYEGTTRAYTAGQYLELYNQSEREIDISGLCIAFTETDNPQAYTLGNLHEAYADTMLVVKQIFRIPSSSRSTVKPGGTVLITNSAIDHTGVSAFEPNLLDADFEAKDSRGRIQNNPATTALDMLFCSYSSMSNLNFQNTGLMGVVLFRTDDDIENDWQPVYGYGKERGNMFKLLPKRLVIDGVECLTNKAGTGPDVSLKRLYTDIDAGYTFINATTGKSGEVVCRRVARVADDGRMILQDTNNSSADFYVSTTVRPREYEAAFGLNEK